MSRRSTKPFNCRALDDLARQLVRGPAAARRKQVFAAEALHDELDPETTYPADFLAYRITGHRRVTEASDTELLVALAVLPDLRRIIDSLSRSVDIADDEADGTWSTGELLDRWNISGKTLTRWRERGLRWRWVDLRDGGRKVIAYPRNAVERFQSDHETLIEHAGEFKQLSPNQRDALIERARRIRERCGKSVSLHRVAQHLSRKTGRPLQTLRDLLEQHDSQQPADAIFAVRSGRLSEDDRHTIAKRFGAGESATTLARQFDRSASTVRRIAREVEAERLLKQPTDYVHSALFDREDAEEVLLQIPEHLLEPTESKATLDDLPESLRPWFSQGIDDDHRLRSLLVRYHFTLLTADRAMSALAKTPIRQSDLDEARRLLRQAARLRRRVVEAVLPRVLAACRQHLGSRSPGGRRGKKSGDPNTLWPLLMLGVPTIDRTLHDYDATTGPRFDSVVVNRLMRRLAGAQSSGTWPEASADDLRRALDVFAERGEIGIEFS